jgi:hypothetical protein
VAEEGVRGLGKGWAPTLIGYSIQGLGKFGFYEVFKSIYANALGEVIIILKKILNTSIFISSFLKRKMLFFGVLHYIWLLVLALSFLPI